MTSKEYLQQIATTEVIDCTYNDNSKKRIADIFSVGISVIEKDLEILEIIKKWSFIEESYKEGYGPYTKFQCIIHTIGMEEDFNKIKEWLNNDNN